MLEALDLIPSTAKRKNEKVVSKASCGILGPWNIF
jgi:hypothetical protein